MSDKRLPNLWDLYGEDEPSSDAASSQFQCVECKSWSPPTRTGETLVSSRHGWRASRTTDEHGLARVEWRCAACHVRFREQKIAPASGHGTGGLGPSSQGRAPISDEPPPSRRGGRGNDSF